MTRGEVRATLVVVALVVVGVIALWPRSSDPGGTGRPGAGTGTAPVARAVDPAELDAARREAALAPCPVPSNPPPASAAPGPPVVAALAAVPVSCLGAPGRVDLGTALVGRTTLVNFWASWCGPCREELPALQGYATTPGAAAVLGVDVEDDPVAALRLLAASGVRYPSVGDPDRAVVRALGAAPVLPASVVVRPDGAVVPLPPEVFRSPEQVRAAVERVVAGPAGAGAAR